MSANNSSQKFIARNRAPRVQIEYDVEIYGSEKKIELPFVMGVLADLSGKPVEALPDVTERKFLEIDIDNFDERMKAIAPRVAFSVPNTLTGEGHVMVDITFESMGKISFMRCDDPNYRYDPKQPYWHREWFEINGQKVLEAAKGESLFWTGEASKDKALWIFDATSLDYPRAKDPTGYGEISCGGSGRRGLYLVDLSKKPPKIIQFGVDKACNEFDWAS